MVTGLAGAFACAKARSGSNPAAATPAAPPTKVLRVIFILSSSFAAVSALTPSAARLHRNARLNASMRRFSGSIKCPQLEAFPPGAMPRRCSPPQHVLATEFN
jgi:hypothetical protein